MSRLKLKQILSNLSYNELSQQLTVNGQSDPSLIISGSVVISNTSTVSGSLTIKGVDTFGDSGSFDTIDLGDNQF